MKSFRVHPDPTSPMYFEVAVHRTKAAMRRSYAQYCRRTGHKPTDVDFAAVTHGEHRLEIRPKRRARTLPRLGKIWLYEARCHSATVAHEITHAALHWARVRGVSLRPAGEERFCLAVGEMNYGFWKQYYAKRRRK